MASKLLNSMKETKNIALVAHDNRKKDLIEWVRFNQEKLNRHNIICTGTTGRMIRDVMGDDIPIHLLRSGPLGGDQQLGAMIVEGSIDILIFFWDPMTSQPHDVDVKALLRITVLYNIPTACNRSTADFIISSEIFQQEYKPILKDYEGYLARDIGEL